MLAAIGDEDDEQQQAGGAGLLTAAAATAAEARQGPAGRIWPQAPNTWFAAAELKFEVAHVTSEREHFAHVVGTMGFNVLRAVMDLVENPPAVDPYTTLKSCLVLETTPAQAGWPAGLLQRTAGPTGH